MILRLSGKLAKKIGVTPSASLPLHANPFLDWSGHLFWAAGVQHVIVTNTPSLYSTIFRGRGITSAEEYVSTVLRELGALLDRTGWADIHEALIRRDDEGVVFSKAFNRSVVGSMNELVYVAKRCLDGDGMTLPEVSDYLSGLVMLSLDETYPHRAFKKQRELLRI